MLNVTKVSFKLISDVQIYLFLEKGKKGGAILIPKNIVKQIISI